jgi:hypothetical protein
MITTAYVENNVVTSNRQPKMTTVQKEARKNRIRQQVEALLTDRDVRTCYAALVGTAANLHRAGRYQDVRILLMSVLEMVLRIHFQIITGRQDPATLSTEAYTKKLRSAGGIDHETYDMLMELCQQQAPYGQEHSERLLLVARSMIQMTYATPDEAVAVRLP